MRIILAPFFPTLWYNPEVNRRGGTAIFTVLLVGSLLATLFFVGAGLVATQLGFQGKQEQRQACRNLAESAASLAMARLLENPDFASDVQVPGLAPGCFAGVRFDPHLATPSGLPLSVNNLKGDQAVSGSGGGVLGPHTAQILAQAQTGSQKVLLEVILYVPRYPYDVASSGPIRCNGNLLVASLRSPAALSAGAAQVKDEDLLPGLLASNAADPTGSKAVELQGAGIRVVGDLQSVGSVGLDPAVTVTGEVRPNSAAAPLPKIELSDFDTAGKPGLAHVASSGSQLTVDGFARHSGKLTLGGGLELSNGVLFVDGDLELEGGIRGQGAVIVTGNTVIKGGGSLGSQNLAALLSGGSLKIQGTPAQSASFQGLVYSGQSLATEYADVAGLLVCNAPPGEGAVKLDNSRVFRLPDASKISFTVTPPAAPGAAPVPEAQPVLMQVPLPALPPSLAGLNVTLSVSGLPFHDPNTSQWGLKANDPWISRWNLNYTDATGTWSPYHFSGPVDQYERTGTTQLFQLRTCIIYLLQNRFQIPLDQNYLDSLDAWLASQESEVVNKVKAKAQELNGQNVVPPPPDPGADPANSGPQEWSLDLSRFMNLSDQIRIQQWREIP